MRAHSAPTATSGSGFRSRAVAESGERSPAVHSANWKEDMLLQKRLQLLNRSQKSLVHRITIDQKVLYRRFQQKLHRSKLSYARMFGDKDKERELRERNLRTLNTDCGRGYDDEAFLAKLRPPAPTTPTARPRDLDSAIAAVMREQITGGERSTRSRPPSAPRPHSPLPHRPATASGTRVESEFTVLADEEGLTPSDRISAFVGHLARQHRNGTDDVTPDDQGKRNGDVKPASDVRSNVTRSQGKARSTRRGDRATGDDGGDRSDSARTGNSGEEGSLGSRGSDKVRGQGAAPRGLRPHTCLGAGSLSETSSLTELPPVLARPQRSAFARLKTRRGSTLFEEDKTPNMRRLFLAEVRSRDPAPRVREFCESLAPLCQADRHRVTADYYTLAACPQPRGTPPELPGTPEAEHRRLWGDFSVRSLTTPALNWDFRPDPYDVQTDQEVSDDQSDLSV